MDARRAAVLVGMIAVSILVGAAATALLMALGHGLLSALLWGYVGGGMLAMLLMAVRMVLCDRQKAAQGREF